MAKVVGLVLGERDARAVEVDGTPKQFRITRWARADLGVGAADLKAHLPGALDQFLSKEGFGRGHIVASLDMADLLAREFVVPLTSEEDLRRTVKFEVETYLPTYDVESMVVDHLVAEKVATGSRVLALAAPRGRVAEHLELLESAGVDPVVLDADLLGAVRALGVAGELAAHPNAILLWLDRSHAKMAVVLKGQVRHLRTIRYTTQPAAKPPSPAAGAASAAAQSGSAEAAGTAAAVATAEIPAEAPPDASVVPALVCELERVQFHVLADPPLTEILAWSHPEREDIRHALLDSLGAAGEWTVVPLDPAAWGEKAPALQSKSGPLDADCLGALGLALRGLGVPGPGLDFRQEEFKYRRGTEAIQGALAMMAGLLAILLAFVVYHYRSRGTALEKEYNAYLAAQTETLKELYPDEKPATGDAIFAQMQGLWEREKQLRQGGPIGSGLVLWKRLSDAIARCAPKTFTMDRLVLDQGRQQIAFGGITDTPTTAGAVLESIQKEFKEDGYTANFTGKGVDLLADGTAKYDIQIALKRIE